MESAAAHPATSKRHLKQQQPAAPKSHPGLKMANTRVPQNLCQSSSSGNHDSGQTGKTTATLDRPKCCGRFPPGGGRSSMVEPQIVILVVAGSSPVGHPTFFLTHLPIHLN